MEYVYEETTVYTILFVVAFFASLVDSIAGGGGLLSPQYAQRQPAGAEGCDMAKNAKGTALLQAEKACEHELLSDVAGIDLGFDDFCGDKFSLLASARRRFFFLGLSKHSRRIFLGLS